jgi:hypothetical protein
VDAIHAFKANADAIEVGIEHYPSVGTIVLYYSEETDPEKRKNLISIAGGKMRIPCIEEDLEDDDRLRILVATAFATVPEYLNEATKLAAITEILCSTNSSTAVQKHKVYSSSRGLTKEYACDLNTIFMKRLIPILNALDASYGLSAEVHRQLAKWLSNRVLRDPKDATIPEVSSFRKDRFGVTVIYVTLRKAGEDIFEGPTPYYLERINGAASSGNVIILMARVEAVNYALSIGNKWLHVNGNGGQIYPVKYDTFKTILRNGKIYRTREPIKGIHVLLVPTDRSSTRRKKLKSEYISEQGKLPIFHYGVGEIKKMRKFRDEIAAQYALPSRNQSRTSYMEKLRVLMRRIIGR